MESIMTIYMLKIPKQHIRVPLKVYYMYQIHLSQYEWTYIFVTEEEKEFTVRLSNAYPFITLEKNTRNIP